MLEFDIIDMSEGIDINKTNESRRCIICTYYYFFTVNFRFQLKVCNECHDLIGKATSFTDTAIVSVKVNN